MLLRGERCLRVHGSPGRRKCSGRGEHRRPPAAAAAIPLSSPLRRAALTFTQTRTWSPVPTNAAPG